ncbi:serine/threonine protein phosphatase 2A 55 kDa regulatory subunit B beta isoform-like isoform X2 [Phalaenopsis equestris]|uniref:serine/threonine protein phosphatase 2A 55 kDa regulatory subunit B beta isoform-like isoform X2 n=1 Tax=Phalaenopsis equestris TaxID=78828 RepID=UPI0009E371F2|nr:serine/threonine protein phosphatase 2A 55 kDa regulatory subunit B beta isoform-like isoform X2 [Phalaenopsis equestris]
MGASAPQQWKFSQVFGERTPGDLIEDVDVISAIEFESRGEYLAIGDHGGRIVLFESTIGINPHLRKELEHMDYPTPIHPRYTYKTEFQSHEPEFDYLTSLEIDEKLNKLRWCAAPNNSMFLLSTNDRTIKLWKVLPYKVKEVKEMNLNPPVSSENTLLAENSFMADQNKSSIINGYRLEWLPKRQRNLSPPNCGDPLPLSMLNIRDGAWARCRRVYAHAHDYKINSISNNSDGESFISADDLRINLWNLEISNQCFNIIDMKPSNMDDLIEVITAAEFHPTHCNLLAYGSSRGFIRLFDMRQSALCDQNARILKDPEYQGARSFFTEIVASISDLKFAKDGTHILSRDYMYLKLWDMRMEEAPVATFKMHEFLRPKLSEMYNNDSIFDKFDCCLSSDGHQFASGSYSNTFKIFTRGGQENGLILDICKCTQRPSHCTNRRTPRRLRSFAWRQRGNENSDSIIPCDITSKVIHMAWHPTADMVACASASSLYIYSS